jgi:hypothetical protein
MSKIIEEALATAEAAEYRIDALLGPVVEPEADEAAAQEATLEDGPQIEAIELPSERIEPREAEIEPPDVTTADPAKPA